MESLVLVSVSLATVIYVAGFIVILTYKHDKIKDINEKLEALNNILDSCDKMIDELNNLSDYIISNIDERSDKMKELTHEADKKIKELHMQVKTVFGQRDSIREFKSEEEQVIPEVPKKRTRKPKNDIFEGDIDSVEQIKIPDNIKPIENINIENAKSKKSQAVVEKTVVKPVSTAISAYENNRNLVNKLDKSEDNKPRFIDTLAIEEHSDIMDRSKKFSLILNSKSREVVELSRQGLDTTEIAKKLGIGKGEIELILGLKK